MRLASATKTALFSMTTSTMSSNPTINSNAPVVAMHWFRKGLRLHDNPALLNSLEYLNGKKQDEKFYAVYILDGDSYQLRNVSPLRANFLVESLADLDNSLQALGSRLYVAKGDPTTILPQLWDQWNVTHVTCETDETGEPYAKERDEAVLKLAEQNEVHFQAIPTETLLCLENYIDMVGGNMQKLPKTMGGFQTMFTNAQKRFCGGKIPLPAEAPKKHQFPKQNHSEMEGKMLPPKRPTDLPWPRNIPKNDLKVVWNQKDCENLSKPLVHGGESNALQQLKQTVESNPSWVASFEKPKTSCTDTKAPSTTGLSPYLSLGCISSRTVWYTIAQAIQKTPASVLKSKPPVSLHGQLMWREFNNLMAHSANKVHPGSWGKMENNIYCRSVPWSENVEYLRAWQEGQTGYPWIDACMVQLKTEGWIHHLGRHAVACFLTRGDLWQTWEEGADYFESQLLDADYALNGFNWLWLSCSGFFYQYFRCYSPVAFQKKNDKTGLYIRKWLPHLSKLPDKYIYEPWKAPIVVQKQAGVRIGIDYPKPIVEHAIVSKENMEKMSLAYEMHKEKTKTSSTMDKRNAKISSNDRNSEPAKKKQKKQMKLK